MSVEVLIAFQHTSAAAGASSVWNSAVGTGAFPFTATNAAPSGTVAWTISFDSASGLTTNAFGPSSAGTGNASWVDEAIITDETLTFAYTRTMTLSGLDDAKSYDIEFFGSQDGAGGEISFTIGGTTKNLSIAGNVANTAAFSGIAPSAGAITVTVGHPVDPARLSAMRITEVIPSALSVTSIGTANGFKAGAQDIPVSGDALDTVTSVILQTDDGTYVDDITAGFFASSPTAATIDHDRALTPLSSATYQLQLIFSDDATPTPNAVSVNVTIDPATGFQLAELTEAPSLTGTSIWEPYTGPDPVIGEQAVVPLLTTGGADIAVDGKGDASYDYTGIDPVPATDSHSAEYWSSNGTQRVITTATVNISEPDLASPYATSVSVPAAGTLVPGNNLDLTVNLDEVANVTTTGGTPRIPLTIGTATRYASYVSGTGTAAHLYRYVVQAGDLDEDGIAVGVAVDLNGGVIQDGAGNDLAPALNNVGDTSGVLVDGVGPSISINPGTTTDTSPVVSGSAGDAVSLALVVNGVTYNPVPTGGSWSQQLPTLALGDYPMTLDGLDAVGNAAVQRQATLSVVDEIPSTVTSVLRPVLLPILSPVLEVSL